MVSEHVNAEGNSKVLPALSEATAKLREHLGESLASLHKYDAPVEQATTSSLDALQAYSAGLKISHAEGADKAIPLYQRATHLDPKFAMAFARMGNAYFNINQPDRASSAIRKAYELREHVSERERLYIEAHFYDTVTNQADQAMQTYQSWQRVFPDDLVPYVNLGLLYGALGQHDNELDEEREGLRLSAMNAASYSNLANAYINLNQFDRAQEVLELARDRKVEDAVFPGLLYQLAFVRGDQASMNQQIAATKGSPGIESWLLALQADTEAYHGHLLKAREYTRRAISSASRDGDEETALAYAGVGALREAELGNWQLAINQVLRAPAHDSGEQVLILDALVFARAGKGERALELAHDLNQRYALDTLLNVYWLPTIGAAVALNRNNPSLAIETLGPTRRYELAAPQVAENVLLYPIYLRGTAYLAAGQPTQAEAEFQKILDHPGLAGNYLLGALAHLGLGRAYAMEAGRPVMSFAKKSGMGSDRRQAPGRPDALAKGRAAYQDFFDLWRDADADIPVLAQARIEYRKLQSIKSRS